jgi:hypothetical protein
VPALFAINESQFEVAVILVLAGGVLASGLLVRSLDAAAAGTRKRDQ